MSTSLSWPAARQSLTQRDPSSSTAESVEVLGARAALLAFPFAGPPVPAQADGGEFVDAARGVNTQRPQPSIDRHIGPVSGPIRRGPRLPAAAGEPGAGDDRSPGPGHGGVNAVSCPELAIDVQDHPVPREFLCPAGNAPGELVKPIGDGCVAR